MAIGDMNVWYMTPEELEAYRKKYPPKENATWIKNWVRITKSRYLYYQEHGFSDEAIVARYTGYTMQMLRESKKRWELSE